MKWKSIIEPVSDSESVPGGPLHSGGPLLSLLVNLGWRSISESVPVKLMSQ